jgi:glyoxylase I family protein
VKRRKLLQCVACVAVATAAATGALGQQSASNTPKATKEAAAAPATAGREAVVGIGGVFFRAHDPKMLAQWYRQHLGIGLTPTGSEQKSWEQEAGPTAFQPFSEKSDYFEPEKPWMLNFRVRNLDRMVQQLQADGIQVKVDPEKYPYGRFARLHDPEGNPIELWQPADKAAH